MAQEYFSDLNYTLSNEDTSIEYELLPENCDRVFSIAGSGARCLPLAARNPKVLDIIDMSLSQNYLCELRWQSAHQLTYEEHLFLLGYRGGIPSGAANSDDRWDLFKQLNLSQACRDYWVERKQGWMKRGFILLGRWESHFQKLGFLFRDILKCDFFPVFEAQSLEEQIELYEKHWPRLRWNTFIQIAASEYVFNKFLYKGHFSGQKEHKTEQRPPSQFIMEEFDRLFRTQLVRKNYFMQTLFLGKIYFEEGLPFEVHRPVFEKIKTSRTQLNFLHGNLLDFLPLHAYNFISLSDTISYLPRDAANKILQTQHPEMPSASAVVIRSFMRAPTAVNTQGWRVLQEKNKWAQERDGTGVYQFHIFQKE